MGLVCNSEGDSTAARMYHMQSLGMKRQLHGGDDAEEPAIASSLHELGSVCYNDGDIKSARMYHEASLKMKQSLYGQDTQLPDIAVSFHALVHECTCESVLSVCFSVSVRERVNQ